MPQNSRTITQKICIRGAKGLEMIFAADSVVRRGDNSVAFYANAECSELVAEHFSENNEDLRRMPPVLVRGDACWVKLAVLPISEYLGVSLFLAKIILLRADARVCYALLRLLLQGSLLQTLRPSTIKNALLKLCSSLIYKIKDIEEKEIENSDTSFLENKLIALEDLKCLYLEMCFLYPKEAENEITEYFQRLLDITVISDTLRAADARLCVFAENDTLLKDEAAALTDEDAAAESQAEEGWACADCTLINAVDCVACDACGLPKRVAPAPPKKSAAPAAESGAVFQKMAALYRLARFLLSGKGFDDSPAMKKYLARMVLREVNEEDSAKRVVGVRNLPRAYKGHPEIPFKTLAKLLKEFIESKNAKVKKVFICCDDGPPPEKPVNPLDNPFKNTCSSRMFEPELPLAQNRKDFDRKGIVHFLATNNGKTPYQNPVLSGKMRPTSGGVECFVGETSTRCLTAGKENAHVEFELCGYRVAASHYAVRHYESWNTEALRSWVFEGSADGREWVVLRAHADDETIKKKGAVSAFAVERTGEAYSRFRIRMTDKNSNMHWYLAICGFDLYGTLYGDLPPVDPEVAPDAHSFALVELAFSAKAKLEQLEKAVSDGGKLAVSGQAEHVHSTRLEMFEVNREVFATHFLRKRLLSDAGVPRKRFCDVLFDVFKEIKTAKPQILANISRFQQKHKKTKQQNAAKTLEIEQKSVLRFYKEKHDSAPEKVRKALRSLLTHAIERKIGGKRAKLSPEVDQAARDQDLTLEAENMFWDELKTGNPMGKADCFGVIALEEILDVISECPFECEEANANLMLKITSLCDEKQNIDSLSFVAAFCEFAFEQPGDVWDWLRKLRYDSDLTKNGLANEECFWDVLCEKDPAVSEESLARRFEKLSAESGESTPLAFSLSQVVAEKGRKAELLELRKRFGLLKVFNRLTKEMLPLIDFKGEPQDASLAGTLLRCKRLIFAKVKENFFDAVLVLTASQAIAPAPQVTVNRIAIAERHSAGDAVFERDTHFGAALRQLGELPAARLRPPKPQGTEPHIVFEVNYKDQNVVGTAGPYRQFFAEVSREMVAEDCGAFESVDRFVESGKTVFFVRAGRSSAADPMIFHTIGILIGCCVRTESILSLPLSKVFWKILVSDRLCLPDLLHVDPGLYMKLAQVVNSAESEFKRETLLDAAESAGFQIPPGLDLFRDRAALAERIMASRLAQCAAQIEWIKGGINKIIPTQILALMTWRQLETLVCGSSDIDIELLRRHTVYAQDIDPDSELIQNFWAMLAAFDQETRRKFVLFAWGHDRLPGDDEAFERSGTRLLVAALRRSRPDADEALPKAHTCFFNLELPRYSSRSVMERKFLYAISHTVTMNADEFENFSEDEMFEDEEYSEMEL